ncbi:Hypothetical protein CINCED_3A016128 [Cinara cedri]|uniref:Uncharacterized protein n=1 Tax=Cinara cedri TaxID=506608 RepID=A0A5E4M8A5_9HEMI|nr:Hypothetical protein CINCED_3A016128 [Cinara cedri]
MAGSCYVQTLMLRTDEVTAPMAAGQPLFQPPLSCRLAACDSVCSLPCGRRTVSRERKLPRSDRVKPKNPGIGYLTSRRAGFGPPGNYISSANIRSNVLRIEFPVRAYEKRGLDSVFRVLAV